jgi:putative transposase
LNSTNNWGAFCKSIGIYFSENLYLFEEFPHLKKRYWGRHFWARGYFCATVGQMTEEMIKDYLEHHFEPKVDDNFRMEPD